MSELKHIGKMKNGRKVVVAYKTVPNEPDNCIVVATESLDADQHDTLMNLVESNTGQTSFELAEAMARSMLPDGRNMLEAFHTTGKLNKYPTTDIIMTPNTKTSLPLNELNALIAEQQGMHHGFRTIINTGAGGGQVIFHLHIHLLAGKELPGF